MNRVMTAPAPGNVHPIGRATAAPSLDPIMNLVADGMNQVNSVILDRMQSRIPLIPELAGHLINGETVKVSSFGSFHVREKGERIGRNPKTGEEVPILPRRVLVFRPSHVLKDRINQTLSVPATNSDVT